MQYTAGELAKILLLRFLDFSLDQIRDMAESDDMLQALKEQENDLMVPEGEVLYDYVSSYSALAVETVKKDRARFMEKIRKEMNRNGCMYIHKSTGMIICKKIKRKRSSILRISSFVYYNNH